MYKWYELLVCTSDIEIRFLCGNIYGMLFSTVYSYSTPLQTIGTQN